MKYRQCPERQNLYRLSQEPANGFYPEPYKVKLLPIFVGHFNIILLSTTGCLRGFISFKLRVNTS
jgi:hypothetical protein